MHLFHFRYSHRDSCRFFRKLFETYLGGLYSGKENEKLWREFISGQMARDEKGIKLRGMNFQTCSKGGNMQ